MALTFSEGSIGGDIESVQLPALEAFYGKKPAAMTRGRTAIRATWRFRRSRPARTASRSRPPNTATGKALL